MPLFGKPASPVIEAVGRFRQDVMLSTRDQWKAVSAPIVEYLGLEPGDFDDPWIIYEFALAAEAIQLQAVDNLLPPDLANRIHLTFVAFLTATPDDSTPEQLEIQEIAKARSIEYSKLWKDCLKQGLPPFDVVAALLCHHVELCDDPADPDPDLTVRVAYALTLCSPPWWKNYLETHRVVA